MDFMQTSGRGTPRRGQHNRINRNRYFHVVGQGWYALTREGMGGPFIEKQTAEAFVLSVIAGEIKPPF